VEGLPVDAKLSLQLQLSSPIEEGTLSQIYDPLNCDPAPEGSIVSFQGVEISTATLSATAKDADIPLGSTTTPQDLAPLCTIDPLTTKDEYVSEFTMAIVGEGEGGAPAPTASAENVPESSDVPAVVTSSEEPVVPLCTVTLKITYKPSAKDQREALYEILNKTSQRKASALENLRKISMMMTTSSSSSSSSSPSKASGAVTKPAVKPGFLNKKKSTEPTRMQRFYDGTIGPNSMLMNGLALVISTRNYLIFFGAVTAFHYKGQLLSIPAPA